GTWAVLQTDAGSNNGAGLIDACDGIHTILEWTGKGTWDPTSEQFLYAGGGHYSCDKFIVYSAATNRWTEHRPYWACAWPDDPVDPHCVGHAFEKNAIDPVRGEFYWLKDKVYRYTIATQSWREAPYPPIVFVEVAPALEYYPERNGLFFGDGLNGLLLLDSTTNQWTHVTDALAGLDG